MVFLILPHLVFLVWLAQCDTASIDQQPSGASPLERNQPDLAELAAVSNKSYGQYSSGPVVASGCGRYEGLSFSDGNGVQFEEFHGIRYAEPPVGPLRFQDPVPWSGCKKDKTYKATQFCQPCMQPRGRSFRTSGMPPSEDCLCLSIYRPAGCSKDSKKPVLYLISGGYFLEGSAAQSIARGGYLAKYGDMIVVTINHRLGAFGFLWSGNNEIPGNMGYYDTVLGAKWVKQYIDDFGGDPDAITIAGYGSAGVHSAIYMLDPEIPKDLFKSVIIMSPDWNQDEFWDPYWVTIKKSKDFAYAVGCTSKPKPKSKITELSNEAIDCLKKLDPETLAEYSDAIGPDDGNGICAWNQLMPFYYPDMLSVDERLEKNLFQKGKSILIGGLHTESLRSLEGSTAQTKAQGIEYIEKEISGIITDKTRNNINAIIDHYLGGVEPSDSFTIGERTTAALDNVCNACPSFDIVQDLSKFNKVYAYYYRYVASCDKDSKRRKYGAFHVDDFPFWFGVPFLEVEKYNDDDRAVSKELISIWSDFVHGRKMKWPAHEGSSLPLLYIEGDAKSNYYKQSPLVNICPRLDA